VIFFSILLFLRKGSTIPEKNPHIFRKKQKKTSFQNFKTKFAYLYLVSKLSWDIKDISGLNTLFAALRIRKGEMFDSQG